MGSGGGFMSVPDWACTGWWWALMSLIHRARIYSDLGVNINFVYNLRTRFFFTTDHAHQCLCACSLLNWPRGYHFAQLHSYLHDGKGTGGKACPSPIQSRIEPTFLCLRERKGNENT